jgi:hypothetical protein
MRPKVIAGLVAVSAAVAAPAAAACPIEGQTPVRGPGAGKIHGNGKLWAAIPRSGVVATRPASERRLPTMLADGSVQDKVLYLGKLPRDGKPRKLVIKGKRIDGEAEPFRVVRRGSKASRNLYWPGYVRYSTTGCWKVVASFGPGTRLAYIVRVDPPPDPAPSRR